VAKLLLPRLTRFPLIVQLVLPPCELSFTKRNGTAELYTMDCFAVISLGFVVWRPNHIFARGNNDECDVQRLIIVTEQKMTKVKFCNKTAKEDTSH